MKNKTTILLIIFLIFGASTAILAQNITLSQNSTLTPMEELGKKIYFDKISSPDKMACADCHSPKVGFTGPKAGTNLHGAAYRGAVAQRFGNRKPPSAAYATNSPVFHYDETEELFIGGNFWDGRATGELLGNPAAEQAQGPFLNPLEHNNASKEDVLEQIANSNYAWMWEVVWGEPISIETYEDIEANYDRLGLTIAEYEASSEVNQFSSKYDYYLLGEVDLTEQEAWGLTLFNDPDKGNCAACHPSEFVPSGDLPLFTDYSFDNLGAPKNLENPFYDMDKVYINGVPINPLGADWIDWGLGGFLESHPDPVWQAMAGENMGKQKVPTLRNVDKRPGNSFKKAYLHNGVFKSLKEVVHFYNTRDVAMWPPPEVADNVNTEELGDLGLTSEEEDAIVAFMATLSDGYNPLKSSPATSNYMISEATLKVFGQNPFTTMTWLSYYLPKETTIELDVFNINGKKVRTLERGKLTAGDHKAKFVANDLPGGVYIIRLQAGSQVMTVKVALIK